mmetsp:Transcript_18200/g.50203  ORF Transcript_18200/g.50203 Transcript_18200/m.50203 type:complete len:155 (+) Transcript_18200:265-729(+)
MIWAATIAAANIQRREREKKARQDDLKRMREAEEARAMKLRESEAARRKLNQQAMEERRRKDEKMRANQVPGGYTVEYMLSDGHTYEFAALAETLHFNPRSPLTKAPMRIEDAQVDLEMRAAIEEWAGSLFPWASISASRDPYHVRFYGFHPSL